MKINEQRVAVFIDHTNVYHRLCDIRKVDPLWVKWYDPAKLSQKLARGRKIVKVGFYCSPPPSFWLQDGKKFEDKYWNQLSYYEAVKKLPLVEVKYGTLSGVKGHLEEKNLDTQLVSDILMGAFNNEYDVGILVANDQDYVSSVENVKKLKRRLELVYFRQSMSMNLRRICDISIRARRSYFEDLPFTNSHANP